MAYTLTKTGQISRNRDGAIIPNDERNADYQDYLAWLAMGNAPSAYVPPAPTQQDYSRAIEEHFNSVALKAEFIDQNRLAGLATSTHPPWAAVAQAFIAWRDAVWHYAYQEFDRIQTGERTQPTVDEFIAELPAIQWP